MFKIKQNKNNTTNNNTYSEWGGGDLCPHSLNCPDWVFLSQGSRIHSTGPHSLLHPFLAAGVQCIMLLPSFCNLLPFWWPFLLFSSLLRSEPQAKKMGKDENGNRIGTHRFIQHFFFSAQKGNLCNLVQNVDIFLNKCWQGWANSSKSVYSRAQFLTHWDIYSYDIC